MYNPTNPSTATAKPAAGSNNNSPRNSSTLSASGNTNQFHQNRQQLHNGASSSTMGGYLNGTNSEGMSAATGPMRSPPPTELQRRESLVKPTWANISPGQVPSTTFDELVSNAKNNGGAGAQRELEAVYGGVGSVADGDAQSELGMLSNKLLAKNGLNHRQKKREVELYDIFGKVCIKTYRCPVDQTEIYLAPIRPKYLFFNHIVTLVYNTNK